MSKVEDFLTNKEEEEIVLAIRQAERNTSGEIRVHIESSISIEHDQRAVEVFQKLEMFKTKQRNAVLIYIAVNDKKFVIYGDQGINIVVSDDFWERTKKCMMAHFKTRDFKQGIVDGVLQVGLELKAHFPWHETDSDELPNEISKN